MKAAIRCKASDQPREYDLVPPASIDGHFGFGQEPPHPDDLIGCARYFTYRVLSWNGRRVRCLQDVLFRHFDMTPESSHLYIVSTKVTGVRNFRLYIEDAWPNSDIQLLRTFLKSPYVNPNTNLLDFGFGPAGQGSRSNWLRVWKGFGYASTNLPRITYITWLPIRRLVAYNEWLLEECEELQEVRDHWWFSREGIDKFRRFLVSESHCLLEVFRPGVGHERNHEMISSYGRAWALVGKLERLVLARRSSIFVPLADI
jgi:hypothetical protein